MVDSDVDVLLKPKIKTKRPPMFQVVLLNDDYTPMDFVMEVLQQFFSKSESEAFTIMMMVHEKGAGVCGVYSRDVAETKAEQVVAYARQHDHPLQCVVEPATS